MKKAIGVIAAAVTAVSCFSCGKKDSSSESPKHEATAAATDKADYRAALDEAMSYSNDGKTQELMYALYSDKYVDQLYKETDSDINKENEYLMEVADVIQVRELTPEECAGIGKAYGEYLARIDYNNENANSGYSNQAEFEADQKKKIEEAASLFETDKAYELSVKYKYSRRDGTSDEYTEAGDETSEVMYAYYIKDEGWAFDTWIYAQYAEEHKEAAAVYEAGMTAITAMDLPYDITGGKDFIVGSDDSLSYEVPAVFDIKDFRSRLEQAGITGYDYFIVFRSYGSALYSACAVSGTDEPDSTYGKMSTQPYMILNYRDNSINYDSYLTINEQHSLTDLFEAAKETARQDNENGTANSAAG